MEALEKAIKLLNQMKAKVAGPKLPEIPAPKGPPMPSMSPPSASKKLPGVNPPSNKDPKKVAEQLKSGQPTKPKIKQEMLKFDANGQWQLNKHDYTGDAKVHGWISPTGEYHHMEPHEAHGIKLMQLLGIKPTMTMDGDNEIHEPSKKEKAAMQGAFEQGWLQVGSGGQQEAFGYDGIINNRTHPATRKLRELIGQHWNHDANSNFFIMNDKEGDRSVAVDSSKFSRFGTVQPKKV